MWPKFSEIFSSRILDFIKWAHSKILLKFSIKISLRMSGYFFLNSLNHKLYSHAFCAKFLYDALPFTVIVSSVVLGRESFSGNLPKCIHTCILSCRRVNSNEFVRVLVGIQVYGTVYVRWTFSKTLFRSIND